MDPNVSGPVRIAAGERKDVLRVYRNTGTAPGTLYLTTADTDAVDPASTAVDSPIVFFITAGAGQTAFELEIDGSRGAVVTVPDGAVNVVAFYEQDTEAGAVEPAQIVGAAFVEGVRPANNATATRTKRIHAFLTGTDQTVLVPPRSVRVTVYASSNTAYGANFRLKLNRAPAGRTLSVVNITENQPFLLPNGIRSVTIENRTGATLSVALVFEVAA
ncbi:MAG: hypothetical protein IPK82_23295 [Polyangiaceae bacterium]|nr:hypothetical protein [Polyangiaceae bacterium]